MMQPEAMSNRAIFRGQYQSLSIVERELFEERASIKEFEADQPREQANREALWDVIRQRNNTRA